MKPWFKLILLFSLIFALALTACAPEQPPAPAATQPPAAEPTKAPEQPAAEPTKAAEQPAAPASGEKVTLTIESWRNDDMTIWQDIIIPAFNKHYPNIEVIFAPSAPPENTTRR